MFPSENIFLLFVSFLFILGNKKHWQIFGVDILAKPWSDLYTESVFLKPCKYAQKVLRKPYSLTIDQIFFRCPCLLGPPVLSLYFRSCLLGPPVLTLQYRSCLLGPPVLSLYFRSCLLGPPVLTLYYRSCLLGPPVLSLHYISSIGKRKTNHSRQNVGNNCLKLFVFSSNFFLFPDFISL